MLAGRGLPRWSKLDAVVRVLAVQCTPRRDSEEQAAIFFHLWNQAAASDAHETGPTSSGDSDEVSGNRRLTVDIIKSYRAHLAGAELDRRAQETRIINEIAEVALHKSVHEVLDIARELDPRPMEKYPRKAGDRNDIALSYEIMKRFIENRPLSDIDEAVRFLDESVHEEYKYWFIRRVGAGRSINEIMDLLKGWRASERHDQAFELLAGVVEYREHPWPGKLRTQLISHGNIIDSQVLQAFATYFSPDRFGV